MCPDENAGRDIQHGETTFVLPNDGRGATRHRIQTQRSVEDEAVLASTEPAIVNALVAFKLWQACVCGESTVHSVGCTAQYNTVQYQQRPLLYFASVAATSVTQGPGPASLEWKRRLVDAETMAGVIVQRRSPHMVAGDLQGKREKGGKARKEAAVFELRFGCLALRKRPWL